MGNIMQPAWVLAGVPRHREWSFGRAALWALLLPLLFLLRPYPGLVQDARIYIGRGLADLDPAGVGRDIMFANDGQTGFSLMRIVIRALLAILSATQVSMLLAFAGCLLWLAAAVAMARSLARGRAAWAAVVCMLVLPAGYGAFGPFSYAQALATPRIFAEAAVLGGLAALLSGRLPLGLALLALAVALHPLMALAGLGVAAVMLVSRDRRWLFLLAAAVIALTAPAALGLPLADRLFAPMDPVWASILRQRATYLFPSLWPFGTLGPVACHLAAVAVAGSLASPRARALLWGAGGVAMAGVAASLVLGDWFPSVLIAQLQPWRALWFLAALGNASLALAAVALWHRGPGGRLTLALLALTWLSSQMPQLAIALGAITVGLHAANLRGVLSTIAPRLVLAIGAVVALVGLVNTCKAGAALATFLNAASAGGEFSWSFVVASDVHAYPLAAAAIAVALCNPHAWSGAAQAGAAAAFLAASVASVFLWDDRTAERRTIEAGGWADALQPTLAFRPGEVLWIDSESETWLVAERPAFASGVQGGPILFSRPLAVEWNDRMQTLLALALGRPGDAAPWGEPRRKAEIALSPDAVAAFCRDRRRPAGLVAPGDQLSAVPPGWPTRLWRPPLPIHRFSEEDGRYFWRTIDVFTVVPCVRPGEVQGPQPGPRPTG